MISLGQILAAWNWFFHEPTLPHSVAVFRFSIGILSALTCVLFLPQGALFFGPAGYFSQRFYEGTRLSYSLNLLDVLPKKNSSVYFVLILGVLSGCSLAAGFHSQMSALIAFVVLVSLKNRNTHAFHSGDSLLRIMLFLMIFSRCGEVLSIDAWLSERDWLHGQRPLMSSPWAERVMQLQVSILYLRTAVWKFHGEMWRKGTAAGYVIQLLDYRRFVAPSFLLHPLSVKVASWSTLVVELMLGTTIWVNEWRDLSIVAGLLLHLVFEIFMNLQLFSFIMMASIMLFVPGETWLNWCLMIL